MAVSKSYLPAASSSTAEPAPAVDDENRRPIKSSIQSTKWQEAQERVLLYLKLLGIGPSASLDLARRVFDEVIDRAQNNASTSSAVDVPAAEAMRVLHRLLADDPLLLQQTPFADYPSLYQRWRPAFPAAVHRTREDGKAADLVAMPTIKRGFMRTKKI